MRASFYIVAGALGLSGVALAAGPARGAPGWQQELREQAARDFHCPPAQVRVEQKGPELEASGCGLSATYAQAGRGWRLRDLPAGEREVFEALRARIRESAARELTCPAEAIDLRLLPGEEARVSGCGREASYAWCGPELTLWQAAAPVGSVRVKELFPDPDPTGIAPFSAGEMTRPLRIAGPDPDYPREALARRASGLMVVKCVISAQGRAERCRALKGLPSLDEAVLAALRARRYSPATFQGRAVAVDYLFKLCLRPPAR